MLYEIKKANNGCLTSYKGNGDDNIYSITMNAKKSILTEFRAVSIVYPNPVSWTMLTSQTLTPLFQLNSQVACVQ